MRRVLQAGVTNLSEAGLRQQILAYRSSSDGAVVKDFRFRPGFIYTTCRAITARINQNYDAWPSRELKKSYRTFLGKPCFVNHNNFDPSRARGRVIAARYIEAGPDKYVEVIQEIDAKRFPKLAHELRTGGLDGVSMGVEAGFTICSYCGNKATDTDDMCKHVKFHKGEKLRRIKNGKAENVLVYENCYKLGFFELSYVFDPADETAVVSKVLVANRTAADTAPGGGQFKVPMADTISGELGGEIPINPNFVTPGVHGQGGAGMGDYGWNMAGVPPEMMSPRSARRRRRMQADCPPDCGSAPSPLQQPGVQPGAGNDPNAMVPVGQPTAADAAGMNMSQYWQGGSSPYMGNPSGYPGGGGNLSAPPSGAGGQGAPVPSAGGGASQWHDQAAEGLRRNGLPVTPDNIQRVLNQIQSESSGNPNAINRTDSNAQAGHPSQGLMQTIPSTFSTYHMPGDSSNINDPQANIDAAINYHVHTYGPTLANPGGKGIGSMHGYDEGGWLPPGETHAINMTGEPELVIPMHKLRHQSSRRKTSYGEIEAPDDVDSLRRDQEEMKSPFKHYLESPEELQPPDLEAPKRFDREQEKKGLQRRRRVEDVDAMSQRQGYRYAAEDDEAGPPDFGEEGPPEAEDEGEGGEPDYGEEDQGGDEQEVDLVLDFFQWCQDSGTDPTPDALDQYADMQQLDDDEYQELHGIISDIMGGGAGEDQGGPPPPPDQGAPPEGLPPDLGGGPPEGLPPQLASRKGYPMGRSTLAERGRVASANRPRHFVADDNGYTDGGPYGRDDQGEQENVFLSETPATEPVAAPRNDDPKATNTENTLVARVVHGTEQLRRDTAALQQFRQAAQYRYAEEKGTESADKVNPELSGTDQQDLKGDFERLQPDKKETQPKDASVRAFAAFDNWLEETTGRHWNQHNANFIRRQAARWANGLGYSHEVLFPTLEYALREARKAERSDMYRTADEKLEVAAPNDRIDVEAPVSDTTDEEAQSSQFDLGDFGNNAGDDVADPDLDTDSQIWAPGEGEKTSSRKADAVAAVRCAEAYINSGLTPPDEKWKLIAQFQTMRHATVVDRTRLLEAVLQANTDAAPRRITAGRRGGTVPRSSIPPGFTSGARRTASTQRTAANDPAYDCALYV